MFGHGSDLGQFPLEFLILHAIQKQHADIRNESLRLHRLAATAAKQDTAVHQDWTVILRLLGSLISDLAADMADEESRFPLLLKLELAYLGEGPAPAYSQPIRDALRLLSTHHRRQLMRLNRVCTMADLLAGSDEPRGLARDLSSGLKVLHQQIHSHSDIESEVFTRAARMEAEMSHVSTPVP